MLRVQVRGACRKAEGKAVMLEYWACNAMQMKAATISLAQIAAMSRLTFQANSEFARSHGGAFELRITIAVVARHSSGNKNRVGLRHQMPSRDVGKHSQQIRQASAVVAAIETLAKSGSSSGFDGIQQL